MRSICLNVGLRLHGQGNPLRLSVDAHPVVCGYLPEDLRHEELAGWGVSTRDEVVEEIRQRVLDGSDRGGVAAEVGGYLFKLLSGDGVLDRWDELEGRLLLNVEDPELQALPWELMQRDGEFLFSNVVRPWARMEGAPVSGTAAPETCPLRVLVVVGSDEGDAQVEAEQEVRAIIRTIIDSGIATEWHVARRPARTELRDLLHWIRPDILHFIGHSEKDDTGDYLVMHSSTGVWEYTTPAVKQDLPVMKPRIVVLNACRLSGQGASRPRSDGSWSVASAYTSAGVPAVVAMQGDIKGDDASAFARALYEQLLGARKTIDVAVAEARTRIEAGGLRARDFGFPTLVLTQYPEAVLDLRAAGVPSGTSSEFRKALCVTPVLDRCCERSRLRSALEDEHHHLIDVVGSPDTGKSWLVRWCLYVRALHRFNVAYVDLARDDDDRWTPVQVISRIREAMASCPLHGASNGAAFEDAVLALEGAITDDPWTEIIATLRERLERAAAQTPGGLLLAIDNLSSVSSEFSTTIGDKLLIPVADGEVRGVRVVVVRRGDATDRDRFTFEGPAAARITVDALPEAERVSLIAGALIHHGFAGDAYALSTQVRASGSWLPTKFKLAQAAAGLGT